MGQNASGEGGRRGAHEGRSCPYDPPPGNNPELFLLEQEHRRERTGSFGSSRKKDRYVLHTHKQEKFSLGPSNRQRPSSESEPWWSGKDSERLGKRGGSNGNNSTKGDNANNNKAGSAKSFVIGGNTGYRDGFGLTNMGKSPRHGKKGASPKVQPVESNSLRSEKGSKKENQNVRARSSSFSSKNKEEHAVVEKDERYCRPQLPRHSSAREMRNSTSSRSSINGPNTGVVVVVEKVVDGSVVGKPTEVSRNWIQQSPTTRGKNSSKIPVTARPQKVVEVMQQNQETVGDSNVISKQDKSKERVAIRRLESHKKKKKAAAAQGVVGNASVQNRDNQVVGAPGHHNDNRGAPGRHSDNRDSSSSISNVSDRRSSVNSERSVNRENAHRRVCVEGQRVTPSGPHHRHPQVRLADPPTPHGEYRYGRPVPTAAPVVPNPWQRTHYSCSGVLGPVAHHLAPSHPVPAAPTHEQVLQRDQNRQQHVGGSTKYAEIQGYTTTVRTIQNGTTVTTTTPTKPESSSSSSTTSTTTTPIGTISKPQNNTTINTTIPNETITKIPNVSTTTTTTPNGTITKIPSITTTTTPNGTITNKSTPTIIANSTTTTPNGTITNKSNNTTTTNIPTTTTTTPPNGTMGKTADAPRTETTPLVNGVAPSPVLTRINLTDPPVPLANQSFETDSSSGSTTTTVTSDVTPTLYISPLPTPSTKSPTGVVPRCPAGRHVQVGCGDLYTCVPVDPSTHILRDQNRNKTTKSTSTSATTSGTTGAKRSGNQPDVVTQVAPPGAAAEIGRLEALCETRTKQLNIARMQLRTSAQGFDAMTVLVRYLTDELDAFSCPEVTAKLKAVKGQLTEAQQQIDLLAKDKATLEKSLGDIKTQHTAKVRQVKEAHREELQKLQQRLTTEKDADIEKVVEKYSLEVTTLKSFLEKNITDMKSKHEKTLAEHDVQRVKEVEQLKEDHDGRCQDLQKQHERRMEEITRTFENIKLTLSEKVETLRGECEEMRSREAHLEARTQREADMKIHMALAQYKHLPAEIESLKAVMEMRNQELHELRHKKLELEKQLEEIPVAREKIISLQQKVENLEAVIQIKADYEKQLAEKHQLLLRKFDKEYKANKRLSMDNEELAWRLANSAESPDLLRRSISHSPTRVSAEPTPEVVRRRKSPACSIPTSPRNQTEFDRSPVMLQSPPKSNLKRSGTYDLLHKELDENEMKQSDV